MASLKDSLSLTNNSKITTNKLIKTRKIKSEQIMTLITDVITIKHMSVWIEYGQPRLTPRTQKRICQLPGPPTFLLLGVPG